MVDFGTAIKKPFTNWGAFVIGLILGAIPIVNLLVSGFVLKVAEDTIKGKKELRSWALGDVPDYIIKIIIAIVIGIVYFIIPIIFFVAGIGSAILTALPQITAAGGSSLMSSSAIQTLILSSIMAGAPLIIAGLILAIIAGILLPMAIMKWLKAGKIGAAFGLGSIIKNVLTGKYWAALIVGGIYSLIVLAILGAISVAIAFIPFVGWIIAALIMGAAAFITNVTMYSMLGQTVD